MILFVSADELMKKENFPFQESNYPEMELIE